MKSPVVVAFLGLLAVAARADTRYYAVYLHDIRVGFYSVTTSNDTYEGKQALRTEARSERTVVYLGKKFNTSIDTTDYSTLDNRPLREQMTSHVDGKPAWHIDCKFGEKNVESDMQATDGKVHATEPIPSSPIYYDESALIAHRYPNPGDSTEFQYFMKGIGVLHPKFLSFRLSNVGYSNLKVDGQTVKAIVCEEKYSGSTVRNLYISPSGEAIRMEEPEASLVYAMTSKEFALSPLPKNIGDTDLAYESTIAVDPRRVDRVDELAEMRVLFQNIDLSTAPSDESQTVVKGDLYKGYSYVPDNPWSVDVHPPQLADCVPLTIVDAVKGQEKWTKPDTFMPSDDPKMKALAAKIIANQKTVIGAVLAIKNYVGHLMKPKAELGVPRDALQILHDRTGTCSDYTILVVTLLRSAGIASRAVSGLVTWDKIPNLLYLHGWAEAWDGKRWVGVDATDRHDQLSACHIKLWEGDMESRLDYQMGDVSKVRAYIYFSQARKR